MKKIAFICGGNSVESEISSLTGLKICSELRKENIDFLLIYYFENEFYLVKDLVPNFYESKKIVKGKFIKKNSSNFFKITISSFFNSMLFIFLAFSFGGSIFGVFLVPVCVALKGVLYGGVTSFLYSQYGLQGIAFNAVLIIPPAFVFLFAFLFASLEALDFSLTVLKLTFPKSVSTNLYFKFKKYSMKYLVISLIVLLSGIFDALISTNFLTKFNI